MARLLDDMINRIKQEISLTRLDYHGVKDMFSSLYW